MAWLCRSRITLLQTFQFSLGVLLTAPIFTSAQPHTILWSNKDRALQEQLQPDPKIWVYSLVGTDYDGHMMLPHFLEHYGSLGVPYSQFKFDLLHDIEESDSGLKVHP